MEVEILNESEFTTRELMDALPEGEITISFYGICLDDCLSRTRGLLSRKLLKVLSFDARSRFSYSGIKFEMTNRISRSRCRGQSKVLNS